jgi:hypothetical protein
MNSQPTIWERDKKNFQKKDLVRKTEVWYKKKHKKKPRANFTNPLSK